MSTSLKTIYHIFETLTSMHKNTSVRPANVTSIMPGTCTVTKKAVSTRPSLCTREDFIKLEKAYCRMSFKLKTKKPSHPIQKIYGHMKTYMSQVPVLGFNSAKYDLNLIKRVLAKHFNMHEETGTFVVKKNNAYTCITTESLKFLDMSQFLAAGSSYTSFLKAYHVAEQKGYFPYEWFNDIAKLEYNSIIFSLPTRLSTAS